MDVSTVTIHSPAVSGCPESGFLMVLKRKTVVSQLQCLFWHIWKYKTLPPHCGLWCVCVCFPSSLWVARKCCLLVGILIYDDEIITVHTLECWTSEVSVQSVSLCIEFCGDVVSDGCFHILSELSVGFEAAERGRLWISSPHCLRTNIVMTQNLLCTHIWLSAEDKSWTDTSLTAAKP